MREIFIKVIVKGYFRKKVIPYWKYFENGSNKNE